MLTINKVEKDKS